MWPDGQQPATASPVLEVKNEQVFLSCPTNGASIAYIITESGDKDFDLNNRWLLYTRPFPVEKGKHVYAIAERIGYKSSEIIKLKID